MEYNHHTQRREMHALALAALNKTCTFYKERGGGRPCQFSFIYSYFRRPLCYTLLDKHTALDNKEHAVIIHADLKLCSLICRLFRIYTL
jgi:hypothetical protein